MLEIWGRDNAANVRKVVWGCEELGLAYRRIDIGGRFGGARDPDYLALNPNGLVPTIRDGDFVLWESHAILRYLAAGPGGRALYPEESKARGLVDQWLDWQAIHQAATVRDFGKLFRPGAPTPAGEVLAAARSGIEGVFALLEAELTKRPYIAGEQFTLADIPIALGAARWFGLPVERPALPAVTAWFEKVTARPPYRAVATTPLASA